jgi:alkylmercury lyase
MTPMNPGTTTAAQTTVDAAVLADRFVAIFPRLDPDGRRVAVTLYRLQPQAAPVSPQRLATASGVNEDVVISLLDAWPGVFREEDNVIGFWGLTPRRVSNHRFQVDGRTLYTWCAWDALFIPAILAKAAHVASRDPQTRAPVHLTVRPDRLERTEPATLVISMLEPREDMLADVMARLCHYIHFFASRASGEVWMRRYPGTMLMALDEAFELGRLKNEARFGDALRIPPVR